jgi:hypothetical protein
MTPVFVCNERRHLTPSQFMTYNAMRAMCVQPDEHGNLICYAQKHNIVNHTSIGMTQNGENIAALVEKGWLIPQEKERWKKGRWANNRYIVIEHAGWEQAHPDQCPPFKYDVKSGENMLRVTDDRKNFPIDVELKRFVKSDARMQEMISLLKGVTFAQIKEWVRQAEEGGE